MIAMFPRAAVSSYDRKLYFSNTHSIIPFETYFQFDLKGFAMSAGAVACSSCGYENVVVGCGFCLQCGTEFLPSAENENEALAQESQIAPAQSAASPEIVPVASPADEALVASATQANSQYAGVDHNAIADSGSVSSDSPIPAGGTEAFQSALLAAEENDDFFAAATEPSEQPIAAAGEANEHAEEWQATAELGVPAATQPEDIDESNDNSSVEQGECLSAPEPSDEIGEFGDEAGAAIVEAVQPADETMDEEVPAAEPTELPTEMVYEVDQSAEPVEMEYEVDESAEPVEPVDEADEPAAEPVEVPNVDDESAGEPVEVMDEHDEIASEPVEPVDEVAAESAEPAATAVEPVQESAEPAAEPAELAAESEPSQIHAAIPPATAEEHTEANAESASDDGAETDVEEVEMVEQISFSDALSRELDRLIAAAANSIDMQMRSFEQGLVGELEIEGRSQHIYVQRNYSSNRVPLLSFFAACGPASQQHALPLLEWNSALPMCAFAIREIENRQMFVVQANVPAFSLDHMTIAATLKEIAKRAGQVQQRIG